MCEAVEATDSRYPGWYCCRDNRFNKGRRCVACGQKRDNKPAPGIVLKLPRKKRGK